jgi:molybdopterin synthase catalytic subunit
MSVTVLLFASLAEKAGTRRLDLPVEAGDTVAVVRDRVLERFPQLEPFVPNLLYALDEEYVKPGEPVAAGATLALIPPVSGGC